jgi:hypothetical protein
MVQPLVEVMIEGISTPIKVSDTHRFLTQSGEYVKVTELSLGDVIQTVTDSTLGAIKSITRIGEGDIIKLEIDDAHTYVVEGARSHNMKSYYIDGNWQNNSSVDYNQNFQ